MQKKMRLAALSILPLSILLSLAPVQAESFVPDPDGTFTFEDISDWEFVFSSGAGAWATFLTIDADGNFEGNYHDSNMGETGDGYPNGTIYVSDFHGAFTEPEKVNDYSYRFRIDYLALAEEPETREILDQILYIYSLPYGIDDAEDFYIYLPGAPLEELPEDFLRWVGYYDLSAIDGELLPFYGLYNEHAAEGFYGSPITDEPGAPIYDGDVGFIESEIIAAVNQSAPLDGQLDSGYLSQSEMNQISYEVYQIWDVALNNIWGYLKETLDSETMSALTDEEIAWIHAKEAAIKEAGQEAAGGTLQPLLENGTAARWTKERVYELQSYYGVPDWHYE